MAWLIMAVRRNELQRSINDHRYEQLQITRELRQLSNFSSSLGDGQISPNEIDGLGSNLFGSALDFMGYSKDAAAEAAQYQTEKYETAYQDATQDQLTNAGLSLYMDESGNLDTESLYQKFYEEALVEYAQEYVLPRLNEIEKDLQDKQTELEKITESEKEEHEQQKSSISGEIQNNTIKLA